MAIGPTKQAKPLIERSLAGSKCQPDVFPGPEGQEKIQHLEINPELMEYLMSKSEMLAFENNYFCLMQYSCKGQ